MNGWVHKGDCAVLRDAPCDCGEGRMLRDINAELDGAVSVARGKLWFALNEVVSPMTDGSKIDDIVNRLNELIEAQILRRQRNPQVIK